MFPYTLLQGNLRPPDNLSLRIFPPSTIMFLILTVIGVNYCSGVVDAASVSGCTHDYQCSDGYHCVTQSQTCARCTECNVYKRTSSWRHCPKVPADCGQCLPGYEEEILAEGKTRDFCIESAHMPSQTDMIHSAYKNVQNTFSSHHTITMNFVLAGLLLFLVPTMFYAFYWRKRTQGRMHCQHSAVPCDEPPPYQSIEVTPDSSVSDSVEAVEEGQDIVINIPYTKDRLVEAIPFRHPDYEDHEDASTREEDEPETDEGIAAARIDAVNLELEDENTMPSSWTPNRIYDNNQLESEQQTVVEREDQDCCQPSNKRRRADPDISNNPQQQQQQQQQQTTSVINVIINNTVKKED